MNSAHATMKPKAGQLITLVSKGIHHSEYSKPWVETDQIGNSHFYRITRVGTKYIYGHYIRFESDGSQQETEWESDSLMEDYEIFAGIRKDIDEAYRLRNVAVQKHEDERRKAFYNIEQRYRQLQRDDEDLYDKHHPRPVPIDINSFKQPAPKPTTALAIRTNCNAQNGLCHTHARAHHGPAHVPMELTSITKPQKPHNQGWLPQ